MRTRKADYKIYVHRFYPVFSGRFLQDTQSESFVNPSRLAKSTKKHKETFMTTILNEKGVTMRGGKK